MEHTQKTCSVQGLEIVRFAEVLQGVCGGTPSGYNLWNNAISEQVLVVSLDIGESPRQAPD